MRGGGLPAESELGGWGAGLMTKGMWRTRKVSSRLKDIKILVRCPLPRTPADQRIQKAKLNFCQKKGIRFLKPCTLKPTSTPEQKGSQKHAFIPNTPVGTALRSTDCVSPIGPLPRRATESWASDCSDWESATPFQAIPFLDAGLWGGTWVIGIYPEAKQTVNNVCVKLHPPSPPPPVGIRRPKPWEGQAEQRHGGGPGLGGPTGAPRRGGGGRRRRGQAGGSRWRWRGKRGLTSSGGGLL